MDRSGKHNKQENPKSQMVIKTQETRRKQEKKTNGYLEIGVVEGEIRYKKEGERRERSKRT